MSDQPLVISPAQSDSEDGLKALYMPNHPMGCKSASQQYGDSTIT